MVSDFFHGVREDKQLAATMHPTIKIILFYLISFLLEQSSQISQRNMTTE